MSCENGPNLMRWLEGSLGAAEARSVEAHLDKCAECTDLVALWRELGELPELAPKPAVRSRFAGLLDRETRPGAPRWAAVAAMVVVAFGAGYAAGNRGEGQASSLRGEVRQLRALVALSLLEQQSAGQRLRGIGFAREEHGDREVVDALVAALQHDSSVDVRLAAARALRRDAANARVRQGFSEAIEREESPLVQVALIEALVELGERRPVDRLRKLAVTSDDDVVRERAGWAARQLAITNH